MKAILFTVLVIYTLSSFSKKAESDFVVQTSENKVLADSTLEHNPPEGIEETEPHFIVKGRKFWIIIDNKRSPESYDENSAIYQYFSQIPETLFNFQEGITHATFVYKDSKNISAVVEVATE